MTIRRLLLSAVLFLAWSLAAEVYYQQDFSRGGIPSHHLIGIVPVEGQPEFKQAMELRSRLEAESRQAAQGSWSTRLAVPAGKPVEIDYWFCPVSGDARYALLVNDTAGKKLITLIWDGRQLLAADGRTGKWRPAGALAAGEWAHIRYVPGNGRYDLYVNDMEYPVLAGVEFREESAGIPGRLWTLGSQSGDSVSRFAAIEVRDASRNRAARRRLVREDFRNYKPKGERQRIVESGSPEFPAALEVSSVKADGKVSAGSWSYPLPDPGDAAELEIDYWFKPIAESSRYALLVNAANGRRIVTVVQEKGKLRAIDGSVWVNAGAVKLNEWNRIRYRLNLLKRTFDLLVDGVPVLRDAKFRDADADAPGRLWTLGSPSGNSETLFGPITVTAGIEEFPPAAVSGAPFFLHAAPPAEPQAELELLPAAGTAREAAGVKLWRDGRNLYARFNLKAADMNKRAGGNVEADGKVWHDDCFELFLQPDRAGKVYFHWVGNAAGTLYDARCEGRVRDKSWNSGATVKVSKRGDGWNALLTVPFAALGGVPAPDAVWGFNAGRENPVTSEVLSRVPVVKFHQPELFGKLCFPEAGDRRAAGERTALLLENSCDLAVLRGELGEMQEKLNKAVPEQLEARRVKAEAAVRGAAERLAAARTFPEYARTIAECRRQLDEGGKLLLDVQRVNACFAPGSAAARRGYAVLVESPMVKVRSGYGGSGTDRAGLRLSGNEYGSFQTVLLARPGRNFSGAGVKLSKVTGPDGRVVDGAKFASYLVEPVMTAMAAKIPEAWPDILRPGTDFKTQGGIMTLWFDLYLPAGTPAGNYAASVTVTPAGMEPATIPVAVTATGLSLPEKASLDTAFCFSDAWVRMFYGGNTPPEKRRGFYRFLLDHRLEPMDLWGGGIDIGEEYLDYCAENGKAMLFLPVNEKIRDNEAKYRELIRRYEGKLRPVFFGYDEVLMVGTPEKLKAMQRDFGIAKELFPEIPRLNTAAIDSRLYGKVDIWCPLFDHLDMGLVRERQAKGEQVWWYPTDYPPAPYANFNLDSPGIDPRVIPWMTWKLGLSGLLYWGLNREWMTNSPKEAQAASQQDYRNRSVMWMTPEIQTRMARGEIHWPQIPWLPYFRSVLNPLHISATNGGGNLMYPAPDREPWASTRLKNLRDGMQDYEYFAMLKRNAEALKDAGTHPELVKSAKAALQIDDGVVAGATSYTQKPAKLLAFRDRLIDLVLETGAALKGKGN
ncbi:MAG: DUF4091 domain-containing protein [Lentisphaeria bacterium]|nr:DUF4091 domain-containing protein [Lentisphaeria bacterium]